MVGLLLVAATCAAFADEPPTDFDLALKLDPEARRLEGHAMITLPSSAAARLELSASAQLSAVVIDGRPAALLGTREGDRQSWPIPAGSPGRRVEVSWQATLEPLRTDLSHRDTLGAGRAVAGPRGSFLPAGAAWYPLVLRDGELGLHRWRVVIDLPAGQHALVPGQLLAEEMRAGRQLATYRMTAPAEGIDLMAGPYVVSERRLDSIDGRKLRMRTLFHAEIADLAGDYQDALARYFSLYENWIGPYPFDDFSIVSSPTPTGFGMPTLTYLGIDVLRLPFIRHTSLGHEVLHNWWGNGVYPDYAAGNWSEGLTTFMADYAFALQQSLEKAQAMRLGWLRDLSAIPPGADRPLREFASRTHGVSSAVGYGKAAMGFVMLQDLLGPDLFDRGIRRFWQQHKFKVASWDQLREAFEAEAGYSLRTFFEQWITRDGLPVLRLAAARAGPRRLQLTLRQASPPYQLVVPLRIDTEHGSAVREVRIAGQSDDVVLDTAGRATRVTLDPEYRLLRQLSPDEAPPILREVNLSGDAQLLILGDAGFARSAEALAERMLDNPPARASAQALPTQTALLLVGQAEKVDAWLQRIGLPQRPPEPGIRGDVQAWALRLPGGKPLVIVSARDQPALEAAMRPLPHLGQASWVVIEKGRSVDRGLWPAVPPSIAVPAD